MGGGCPNGLTAYCLNYIGVREFCITKISISGRAAIFISPMTGVARSIASFGTLMQQARYVITASLLLAFYTHAGEFNGVERWLLKTEEVMRRSLATITKNALTVCRLHTLLPFVFGFMLQACCCGALPGGMPTGRFSHMLWALPWT